jgi:hypothetical protein
MAPKKKVENPSIQETSPRKRSTKIKYTVQQEDFRTTIPSHDYDRLNKGGNKLISKSLHTPPLDISKDTKESVSQLVDSVKKSKQDAGKIKIDPSKVIKTNPGRVSKNLPQTDKSILHKLKDAISSFLSGFKK